MRGAVYNSRSPTTQEEVGTRPVAEEVNMAGYGIRVFSARVESLVRPPKLVRFVGDTTAACRSDITPGAARRSQLVLKRLMDIFGAGVLIVLAAPLMLIIAVLIKLTSKGPVCFAQVRPGLEGRPFRFLKFRSMVTDQNGLITPTEKKSLEEQGILPKRPADPRITRVGRWIRVTSLDELPQLFNVLAGQMSLVGPRPVIPQMLAPYPAIATARLAMRPGITGLWQVSNRENNSSILDMWPYDKRYIEGFNVWLDIRILAVTAAVVLGQRGAY
jgi:exopolysaccharide production protein ExoY